MRNKFKAIVFLSLASSVTFAQDRDTVDMADTMRSSGKIYVVIAVILTILFGLIMYVVRLDRKITKLEQSGKH